MRPSKLNMQRKRIHVSKIIARVTPLEHHFQRHKKINTSALSSIWGQYILKQQNPTSMKVFQVICGSYVDKIQQLEAMRTSIREMFKSHIYEDIKIKINFFKLNNHAVQHFVVRLWVS